MSPCTLTTFPAANLAGTYQVAKLQNNSWAYVSDWAKSSAIKTGNATNPFRVVGNGDKLSFYANGVKLTDYSDSSGVNP